MPHFDKNNQARASSLIVEFDTKSTSVTEKNARLALISTELDISREDVTTTLINQLRNEVEKHTGKKPAAARIRRILRISDRDIVSVFSSFALKHPWVYDDLALADLLSEALLIKRISGRHEDYQEIDAQATHIGLHGTKRSFKAYLSNLIKNARKPSPAPSKAASGKGANDIMRRLADVREASHVRTSIRSLIATVKRDLKETR